MNWVHICGFILCAAGATLIALGQPEIGGAVAAAGSVLAGFTSQAKV